MSISYRGEGESQHCESNRMNINVLQYSAHRTPYPEFPKLSKRLGDNCMH